MHNHRKKILITGANGYIGQRLVIKMLDAGYDINVLVRDQNCFSGNSSVKAFQYDFSSLPPQDAFEGVSVLVHLAAITSSLPPESDGIELKAARQLIECAHFSGVKRILFISSQTAKMDAPTTYGRTKWEIEQEILKAKGLVARPGQVYGGKEQGLFGVLVKTVRKFPIIPRFVPAPKVQPVHVDDLAEGLLRMTEQAELSAGVYSLASRDPVDFSSFLSSISKYRVRSFRLFIPVPVFLVSLSSFLLGRYLSDKLSINRLKSLFKLEPMETGADLKRLNLILRPIHAGMHPSGDDRRRCLLMEGNALLHYILKEKPRGALLRRYVHAIEQVRDASSLGIPSIFLKLPILLALLDDRRWVCEPRGKELAWRLDAATLMAEATTAGASSFLGLGRRASLLINLSVVVRAVVSELFWRAVKIISYSLLIKIMRQHRGEK